jgi:hypothetical protein
LVTLCRSVFDLLQEALAALWANVTLADPSIKKRRLPGSFREVIMFKGVIADAESTATRFGIPIEIAKCYERCAGFFSALRTSRDNVVHGGSRMPAIFAQEDGWYIQKQLINRPNVPIWRESERLANGLVPLMPAIGAIIACTLRCCDDFSSAFSGTIGLLPRLVPDMHYFVTSVHCPSLHALLQDAGFRMRDGLF